MIPSIAKIFLALLQIWKIATGRNSPKLHANGFNFGQKLLFFMTTFRKLEDIRNGKALHDV